MFIKYNIIITKTDTIDTFVCKETSIETYSARFGFCSCGRYYPEATALNNCEILIKLLVEGTAKPAGDRVIAIGSANTELCDLADRIKPTHTIENSIIKHSINNILRYINTEYGREYNYHSCTSSPQSYSE